MGHSPTSSIDDTPTFQNTSTADAEESHHWLTSLAFILIAAFFSVGYYALATFLLGGTLIYVHISQSDGPSKPDMIPVSLHVLLEGQFVHEISSQTLETLSDLVAASNVWDSVVQEAITIVDKDERR
jgi:hypothetical protein